MKIDTTPETPCHGTFRGVSAENIHTHIDGERAHRHERRGWPYNQISYQPSQLVPDEPAPAWHESDYSPGQHGVGNVGPAGES